MTRPTNVCVLVLILFLSWGGGMELQAATSYYVSSSKGDDGAAGTGPDSCWKTLARAGRNTYRPGDRILLKCGDRWEETFACKGDGTATQPIVLSSYGDGRMPRIEGKRKDGSICVYVEGVNHWTIKGLELCFAEYGIVLDGRKSHGKKGIAIEGCFFHDLQINKEFYRNKVDGPVWGGAVQVWSHQTIGDGVPAGSVRIDDVKVRNCISLNCDGFFFQRHHDGGAVMGAYGNTLIEGCTIKGHPANTVMLLGFKGDKISQTVRTCVFSDNGGRRSMPWGGTDVMMASCRNAVIEDSEFADRKAFAGNPDGCALDYEGDVSDSIIRRCDIHGCRSGALLVMHYKNFVNVGMVDCLLRYNGREYKRYELWNNSATVTGPVRNNTYYLEKGTTFLSNKAALTVEKNAAGTRKHVAKPAADPAEGTYRDPVTVKLSCATEGAVIRYTTDGSYPGPDAAVYDGPITIGETAALNAKAYKDGMERSYALSAVYVISHEPGPADGKGARPLVGTIRWDAWTGGSVTEQVEKTLGPARYHDRLPWFAEVIGENKVRIDGSPQKVMDREIEFAAAAGLDYWAFLVYEESNPMTTALARYLKSPHRKRIGFCLIVHNTLKAAAKAWPKERDRAVALLKEPGYVKVMNGRPLLYAFCGLDFPFDRFAELRAAAKKAGFDPYCVYMGWNPAADFKMVSAKGFDAVSAYARGGGQNTFADLVKDVEENYWKNAAEAKVPYVPMVTTGWDKRPRKDNPVSWEKGQAYHTQKVFPSRATPEEIAAHLDRAISFARTHPDICAANAVIIYAWNEHDEGGWLSPTRAADGTPDTTRLDAIRKQLE